MSKVNRQSTKGNIFASRAQRSSGGLTGASQSRYGKRSDLNVSASRRSVALSDANRTIEKSTPAARNGITVYDDDGNDVTPKALFSSENAQRSQLFASDNQSTAGTPTDLASFTSLFQTGTTSVYAQPFSRSVFGSTSNRSQRSRSKKSSIESSGDIAEAVAEISTGFADVQTVRREEVEELTEEDLNKVVDIILEESDTIWLFEQKGIAVSEEAEDSAAIMAKNQAYEELCKAREGNDKFVERGMQTFNNALKNKDIQAEKVGLTDMGLTVSNWDMYDTYNSEGDAVVEKKKKEEAEEVPLGLEDVASVKLKSDGAESSRITESRASMLTMSVMGEAEPESAPAVTAAAAPDATNENGVNPQWEAVSGGEAIISSLQIMERVVTENIYQGKQAAYRGMPVLIDPDKEKLESESAADTSTSPEIMTSIGPTLDRLWSYHCSLTKGRNVSCLAWNKLNPDILAVGYGAFGYSEQSKTKGGLACCWNLKNPEFPERTFNCKSSVTAADFSTTNPNLLAIGLYDGTVCIYNVRKPDDQTVVDSFDCAGKHSSPVWQLKWIEKETTLGDNKGEILVSIAADGRIVQWQIRKGFECQDLMKLKRTASKNVTKKKEKAEALISRQAPGMCFAFNSKESSMYLAGTEEGLIHKCSCSYNEQFLDSYPGHTGSVYKLKWSPFSNDVFLSCSADWSIKLWTQGQLRPVLNFLSTTKAVNDIAWSPYSPTVFCAVNEGAIEIWDLAVNTLDPLITNLASPSIKLGCCVFSANSNSILVGDSDGQVSIYQLRNVGESAESSSLEDIISSSLASVVEDEPEK